MQGSVEYIIAGLGNPGAKYDYTRHNAGFITVDALAEKMGIKIDRLKFKALYGIGRLGGKGVMLLKPQTFMNLSGEAVRDAMQFYKVRPENVIIIYDDISLDPGKLRIRRKGSDGGHNGMKNIIYLTGSDAFPRIKMGVGAKPNPDYDLAAWVLSRFTKDEGRQLEDAVENACKAAELMVGGQTDKAMNSFNS